MDSLTSLTSFVRTAETLSFVQAARLLGISASAVGKNVARLEQKLGVRLFNRSTRSVSLTAEGAVLLVRCQQILEQLQDAEAELTRHIAQPSGKLRVSLPVTGYRLLLPLLPSFTRRYPAIELELDFSDRLVNIIDEGFDVAIRSGEIADSRLTSKTLGSFRFVLCASPSYLLEYGSPASPEDLNNHKCILYRFPSTGLLQPWEMQGVDGVCNFTPVSVLTANNIEAVIRMSTAGMGISYVPDFVVHEALEKGELREVLPGSCRRQGQFSALWATRRHLSPRIRCFIDFMSENGMLKA
jgi:DNA-binding transcriptional LysR family regulator